MSCRATVFNILAAIMCLLGLLHCIVFCCELLRFSGVGKLELDTARTENILC